MGVIADTGYGVGGVSQGLDTSWDDPTHLRDRIADGVVAVTQAEPGEAWGAALAPLRGQLPRPLCVWSDPVYAALPVPGEVAQEAEKARRAAPPSPASRPRPARLAFL